MCCLYVIHALRQVMGPDVEQCALWLHEFWQHPSLVQPWARCAPSGLHVINSSSLHCWMLSRLFALGLNVNTVVWTLTLMESGFMSSAVCTVRHYGCTLHHTCSLIHPSSFLYQPNQQCLLPTNPLPSTSLTFLASLGATSRLGRTKWSASLWSPRYMM